MIKVLGYSGCRKDVGVFDNKTVAILGPGCASKDEKINDITNSRNSFEVNLSLRKAPFTKDSVRLC